MSDHRILVVGAGPAGLSAAVTLAGAGQNVTVVDQAPDIGGAVYAQNRTGIARPLSHGRERRALFAAVAAQKDRIDLRCSTAFAGLDYQGNALITGPDGLLFRPKAIIMATGARELVRPRPGWTRPGVTSVGALQVSLKTTGRPPEGRIAIAGSGPLLYALGAQLARAGNAPIAIIDAARPFLHPLTPMRLPIPVLREAAGYVLTLIRARVPILCGIQVRAIGKDRGALQLETTHRGRFGMLRVDRLGLHDGLARNDYGLTDDPVIPVIAAGDCREVLGRFAAVKDGKRAASEVLQRLGLTTPDRTLPSLKPERAAQNRLGGMFSHDSDSALNNLPEDTILCRCENRTRADLMALTPTERTPRMLRLNGRFGMGPCQGRFCLDWVAKLAGDIADPAPIRGSRWPLRPMNIEDILNAADDSGSDLQIHPESAK
jgi:Pyridine nucleotide-disulphide oxidoreductase